MTENTTSTSIFPTVDRPCPPWCNQHRHIADDSGTGGPGPTEAHGNWLCHWYPPISQPEDENRRPVVALHLSQLIDSGETLWEPGMSLTVFGQEPPAAVSPREARALAAALIRGAEIVEACLTDSCRTCGEGIPPQAEGQCSLCGIKERVDRRATMKASLRSAT